ncbi:MAG: ACT domain-containing protein [Trueperaceae bacterium]
MILTLLPDMYAICRLEPKTPVPTWATGEFVSITQTPHELSIVCAEAHVPPEIKAGRGWRTLQVEGPIDLSVIGVLASLTKPLAEAGINLFAISSYDTDYLLVENNKLSAATAALGVAGFTVKTF